MKVLSSALEEVKLIEPVLSGDDRGAFFESFNERRFNELVGFSGHFVQDNHSTSKNGVLRGLHYQVGAYPQGKLVRVVRGEVFDVAVDIRKSSPSFGRWVGFVLSADNRRQLWIPPGFAHGFLVMSDTAEFLYKTTDYWVKELERSIIWNCPEIGIDWPLMGPPSLSEKDTVAPQLSLAETFD